ncbi:protein of unknown function [Paraburkholderia kururiensis]
MSTSSQGNGTCPKFYHPELERSGIYGKMPRFSNPPHKAPGPPARGFPRRGAGLAGASNSL